MSQEQEYVSGLGKDSVVPPEIKGWNWGAFLLNWIWGIGNSTYIALLMFVPLVNIFMFFILGAKGNEWAWRNRTWRDVEHFKQTQKKWRNAGLILFFVMGSIQTSGANGEASLQYSISGPKGDADVYVQAYKEMEAWELYNVIVHWPESDKKIQVVMPVK